MDPLTRLSVKTATTPVPVQLPKRPSTDIEDKVDQQADILVPKAGKTETKAIDPPKDIRSATAEEKASLDKTGEVAATAVDSVKHEKLEALPSIPEKSIHDKWEPRFRAEIKTADQSAVREYIADAQKHIATIKKMYTDLGAVSFPPSSSSPTEKPPSKMEKDILHLLKEGKLEPVAGGMGGVYFLCDKEGARHFVIKPGDQANFALNNNKRNASPYLREHGVIEDPYVGVQNSELASRAATRLGLEGATPETKVMIIEHEAFHDLFDDTEEKTDAMPSSKAKVCSVQSYLGGYEDFSTLIRTASKMTKEELTALSEEDLDAAIEAYTPRDIDQLQYEKMAILSLIIGEKDGNWGNFLCPTTVEKGKERPISKIDNDGAFPENNKGIQPGLFWASHSYGKEVSAEAKELIKNITPEKIKDLQELMKSRGKSDQSIKAFEARVEALKMLVVDETTWATVVGDFETYCGVDLD